MQVHLFVSGELKPEQAGEEPRKPLVISIVRYSPDQCLVSTKNWNAEYSEQIAARRQECIRDVQDVAGVSEIGNQCGHKGRVQNCSKIAVAHCSVRGLQLSSRPALCSACRAAASLPSAGDNCS